MDGERENEGRGMGEMVRNYERFIEQLPTYRELVKVIEAIQGPKWLNAQPGQAEQASMPLARAVLLSDARFALGVGQG